MNYHMLDHDKLKLNLMFREQESNDFIELWNAEISVENIAKKMKRKPLEIALLKMDRAELELIKMRPKGLDGL